MARSEDKLQAGAAKIDITPPLGTRINGDFVTHFATNIHDPLYARCLILQNGYEIAVFLIVDICTLSASFVHEVKEKILRLGHDTPYLILRHNIIMASTHTHAAGAVEEVHLGALDMAYRTYLLGQLPKVVAQAQKKVQPAQIAHGRISVPDHVLCRRYYMKDTYSPFNPVTGETDIIKTNPFGAESFIDRPAGEVDPEVSWLAVQSMTGEWISVLANYSLHYVGDWENGTISADYYGVFAEALKKELNAGDDFVGMMSNGTSGDINIWDFEGKKSYPAGWHEKSQVIGEDIAARVKEDLMKVTEWTQYSKVKSSRTFFDLRVRKPNYQSLAGSIEIVKKSNFEHFVYSDQDLRKAYAREQVLLNELPDEIEIMLHAIKLGDLIIGALPGEFFAETGRWLKDNAPSGNYFSIGVANGNIGYVPPAAELDKGGYETWRCRYSCMERDAEEIIRKKMKSLIDDLTGPDKYAHLYKP